MNNHETTIRPHFAALIRPMRATWKVYEEICPYRSARLRPDIFITEEGRKPIPIEIKIDDERSCEDQAKRHLNQILGDRYDEELESLAESVPQRQFRFFADENFDYDPSQHGRVRVSDQDDTFVDEEEHVTTALAVIVPARFRDIEQTDIQSELEKANDIRYILCSFNDPTRFPKSGWLKGTISDIATAIRIGSTPVAEIEAAAKTLEDGIKRAAARVKPSIGEKIERILHQKDGEQTRRMAMLIISNALVFQDSLADKLDVPSLNQLVPEDRRIDSDIVLGAWETIQNYNYHPIFGVASKLVRDALATDSQQIGKILYILRNTAKELVEKGLTKVHELSGIVFQNLIVDRRFIKANYTRPESVALLSSLILVDSAETSHGCEQDIRESIIESLPNELIASKCYEWLKVIRKLIIEYARCRNPNRVSLSLS